MFDPGFKIITVCLSQPKFEYFLHADACIFTCIGVCGLGCGIAANREQLNRPKDLQFQLVCDCISFDPAVTTAAGGGCGWEDQQRRKKILMQLAKLQKEVSSNNSNTEKNSKDIENIFMVLKELLEKESKPTLRNKIGFKQYD